MRTILLLCTPEDEAYFDRLQRLDASRGVRLLKTTTPHTNTVQVSMLCDKHKVDAVMTTQPKFLEAALYMSTDYTPPPGNKKPALDDYAGSIIHLRDGRELLVLNPLERLRTVTFEQFVVNRYVSKLTRPERWQPARPFKWRIGTAEDIPRIMQASIMSVDIETNSDEHRSMSCVGYGCYYPDTDSIENYVFPVDSFADLMLVREINACQVPKLFQGGLYDNAYFLRWGVPVTNWAHDSLNLFHCWLAELPKRLDFIGSFAVRDIRFWKDDGKTGNKEDHYRYNARDCWATLCGYFNILAECPAWVLQNYRLEFRMNFPALHASLEGLERDKEIFDEVAEKKKTELEGLRQRIGNILGAPAFNPNSPPQVVKLLQVLGDATATSSDKIAVQKASAKHPLNEFILALVTAYRKALKLTSTYLKEESFWNNRLLYKLDPAGTDTCRASSSESQFWTGFQIQNIPAGDSIKQFLMAPPGWFLAECDKKQAEARCVAYLSGDQNLMRLVESDHDYHSWNAAAFFGVPYESIYDEATDKTLNKILRNLSKRTNHGANYNMGASVLLDTMGPKAVAEAKIALKLPRHFTLRQVTGYLLAQYEATYPDVKGRYYKSIINEVVTTGKIVSPFNWTRVCFGKPTENKLHLNSLVAHPSQHLSVMIVNVEWYNVWRLTVYGELRGHVRIKAQIHDSLLFIYRQNSEWAAKKVQELMNFKVPVKGSDGVTRELAVPTDLSMGEEPTRYWSELK